MSRKQLVVLGAGGMLGRAFSELAPELSHKVDLRLFPRAECDICDPQNIASVIDEDTAVAINCAAWTDVDGAESNHGGAFELNHLAPKMLAERCAKSGTKLVHFSTDYVFAGEHGEPYEVAHKTGPLNAYGRSKLLGEHAIAESGCDQLVVRTSWLFAPWGKNFVRTMLRLGAERDEIRVVDDQVGRPTSCQDLAKATLTLIDQGERGTFHVANRGEASWYQLAAKTMELAELQCRVTPCRSSEYPTVAKRPRRSVLGLGSLERCEPPIAMRIWQDALADVISKSEVPRPSWAQV